MGQRDANYVLSGLVEMDDCYLGGPCSDGRRGRGTDKIKVVVALSKTDQGIPLFAHMQVVKDLKTETLQEFVNQHLAENTVVECDGYSSYCGLTGVNCNRKAFDAASGDLKWLHKSISNLKPSSWVPTMAVVPSFSLISTSSASVSTAEALSTSFSQTCSHCHFILCSADVSR